MADLFGGNSFDPKEFERHVDAFEREIPDAAPRLDAGDRIGRRLLTRLRELIDRLTALSRALDPVEHSEILDPSRPEVAGEVFTGHLLKKARAPLTRLKAFYGSGVYALYYGGDHAAYAHLSGQDLPIYVGKAEPDRPDAANAFEQGTKLFDRLSEHLRNIVIAERYASDHPELTESGVFPIRSVDFSFRCLVLNSPHAGAVEQVLLNTYSPPWNTVAGGFGKHGDASSTRKNTRSEWDTIHPGRKWALTPETIPNPLSPLQIQQLILDHTAPKG